MYVILILMILGAMFALFGDTISILIIMAISIVSIISAKFFEKKYDLHVEQLGEEFNKNPSLYKKEREKELINVLNQFATDQISFQSFIRIINLDIYDVGNIKKELFKILSEQTFYLMNDQEFENKFFEAFRSLEKLDEACQNGAISFFETFNEHTFNNMNYAVREIGFSDFNFVEISRNSMGLEEGEYIYHIDKNFNLCLAKVNVRTEIIAHTDNLLTLSYANLSDRLSLKTIKFKDIRDFQLFGNQQVVLDFNNMDSINQGSMINEYLFGVGTSIIKGLQKTFDNISEKTIDLRTVQLITKDNSDIVFKGINIYYDLNRIFQNN